MDKKTSSDIVDEIVSECVAGRLRILGRVITGIYDGALRPLGVRVSQVNILVATAKFGIARPGEVCEVLQLDHSTLSRNVERMVARGWLETLPDEEDGRGMRFRLTQAGQRLLTEEVYPLWKDAQKEAEELLGQRGIEVLKGAIRRSRGREKE